MAVTKGQTLVDCTNVRSLQQANPWGQRIVGASGWGWVGSWCLMGRVSVWEDGKGSGDGCCDGCTRCQNCTWKWLNGQLRVCFTVIKSTAVAAFLHSACPETSVTHRLEHGLGQKTGCDFADVTLASHLTKDVAIEVGSLERNPSDHKSLRPGKAEEPC
jgi:hypothetical protein